MNQTMAALVRRHDPDRFLTSLFAPPEKRDALLTLYAFNHELARAREAVSEPPLALIRLQWWREVVEAVTCAFRERVSARPGESIRVSPDPALVHLFDETTGQRVLA
jgi:15-cis-phytoene synthase